MSDLSRFDTKPWPLPKADSVREVVGEFTRIVEFSPGFIHRAAPDYGCAGVKMRLVLVGPRGAASLDVHTGMMPKAVERMWDAMGLDARTTQSAYKSMAASLDFHGREPVYDGQEKSTDRCDYIGGDCYCDGSCCNADAPLEAFIVEGLPGAWRHLEAEYRLRVKQTDERKASVTP